ncbi:hypothetical protein IMSAGC002_02705 [Lachnospiraceae bacterium]|jgi:hypothetical protein|nr:DUF4869 domain-containing protein [Lachnospiraceae bacterium]GFH91449.1 hypothetical protein IMSAGC002_02705 [Lachnospiraceae bacterium]
MIHILFGTIKRSTAPRQYIHDIDGFFDGYFCEQWMNNEWADRVLELIDKSILIAPKIVESPILGSISHEWISGGAKQLIMMNCEQYIVYDGDNLGDNCWELLLELGQTKDIMMSLSYYPRFSWIPGGKVHILNSDITVTDFKSFNKLHLMTEDRNREFDFYEVHWPFPIDMTKFALEEIDF